MSTATVKVPPTITQLTVDDWSVVIGTLDEPARNILLGSIESQLAKKRASRKRTFKELDSDGGTADKSEPVAKKAKTELDESEPVPKKAKTAFDVDAVCVALAEQAHKDGIVKSVVGGLLLNDKQEMLVLQRAANEFMPNIYEIPSGTKDPEDKTLIDCLTREVKEESGLVLSKVLQSVDSFDYQSSSGKNTRQFNFCVTVESSDEIKISEEHQAFAWVKQADLFDEEDKANKYNDIVGKITPEVRKVMRKGFKLLT